MSRTLEIPSPARLAAGWFFAGAGLVGIVWAFTSRRPTPPPPDPVPVVVQPGAADPSVLAQPSPQAVTATSSPHSQRLSTSRPEPSSVANSEPSAHTPPEPDSAELDTTKAEPGTTPYPFSPIPIESAADDREPVSESVESPSEAAPVESAPPSAVQRIAINSASAAEMQLLPGIGPVLADRIVADRTANGPFRDVADLQRVRGIGEKTAAKLAPMITFE